MPQHETKRDHVLRRPLEQALASLSDNASLDDMVTEVLRTLDQQRMIHYAPSGSLGLLSTHGRVLVAVMEDPDITQRALSVYLGVSESNVQKSLKLLVEADVVTKTKTDGANTYQLNLTEGMKHPDIARFYDAINSELIRRSELSAAEEEATPF